jgi:hypothetical protein
MVSRVRARYKPANKRSDLPPGSPYQAFNAFLLSEQVQQVAIDAAQDIAGRAVTIYLAEFSDTGETAASVDARADTPVRVAGNVRACAVVTANGGRYPGAKDPEASKALIGEFGNAQFEAKHILHRAGLPYDNPRALT